MELFKCAACGGTFEKARSDEEALKESKEKFGDIPPKEIVTVCGPCYQLMLEAEAKEQAKPR